MIYRNFSFNMSAKGSQKALVDIANCATIVSSYSLGYPTVKTARSHTIFLILGFSSQEKLDKFHARGNATTEADSLKKLKLNQETSNERK